MGNKICVKCGVPYNYYNDITREQLSCRVHTCSNLEKCNCGNSGNGNCYHLFKFRLFGSRLKKPYKPVK